MSMPMRKDQPQLEEDLTAADLSRDTRPAVSDDPVRDDLPKADRSKEGRPGPLLAARPSGETAQSAASQGVSSEELASKDRNSTDADAPLFPNNELQELRDRWSGVQTAFVDEPRSAVEQADGLVAAAMKRLAEVFAEERSRLEQQWDRGDNVSTEDLRIALQRYRSFFQRLLSI
jgi:hypothetical protein